MPSELDDEQFKLLQKAVDNVDSAYASEVFGLSRFEPAGINRMKIRVAYLQLKQIIGE